MANHQPYNHGYGQHNKNYYPYDNNSSYNQRGGYKPGNYNRGGGSNRGRGSWYSSPQSHSQFYHGVQNHTNFKIRHDHSKSDNRTRQDFSFNKRQHSSHSFSSNDKYRSLESEPTAVSVVSSNENEKERLKKVEEDKARLSKLLSSSDKLPSVDMDNTQSLTSGGNENDENSKKRESGLRLPTLELTESDYKEIGAIAGTSNVPEEEEENDEEKCDFEENETDCEKIILNNSDDLDDVEIIEKPSEVIVIDEINVNEIEKNDSNKHFLETAVAEDPLQNPSENTDIPEKLVVVDECTNDFHVSEKLPVEVSLDDHCTLENESVESPSKNCCVSEEMEVEVSLAENNAEKNIFDSPALDPLVPGKLSDSPVNLNRPEELNLSSGITDSNEDLIPKHSDIVNGLETPSDKQSEKSGINPPNKMDLLPEYVERNDPLEISSVMISSDNTENESGKFALENTEIKSDECESNDNSFDNGPLIEANEKVNVNSSESQSKNENQSSEESSNGSSLRTRDINIIQEKEQIVGFIDRTVEINDKSVNSLKRDQLLPQSNIIHLYRSFLKCRRSGRSPNLKEKLKQMKGTLQDNPFLNKGNLIAVSRELFNEMIPDNKGGNKESETCNIDSSGEQVLKTNVSRNTIEVVDVAEQEADEFMANYGHLLDHNFTIPECVLEQLGLSSIAEEFSTNETIMETDENSHELDAGKVFKGDSNNIHSMTINVKQEIFNARENSSFNEESGYGNDEVEQHEFEKSPVLKKYLTVENNETNEILERNSSRNLSCDKISPPDGVTHGSQLDKQISSDNCKAQGSENYRAIHQNTSLKSISSGDSSVCNTAEDNISNNDISPKGIVKSQHYDWVYSSMDSVTSPSEQKDILNNLLIEIMSRFHCNRKVPAVVKMREKAQLSYLFRNMNTSSFFHCVNESALKFQQFEKDIDPAAYFLKVIVECIIEIGEISDEMKAKLMSIESLLINIIKEKVNKKQQKNLLLETQQKGKREKQLFSKIVAFRGKKSLARENNVQDLQNVSHSSNRQTTEIQFLKQNSILSENSLQLLADNFQSNKNDVESFKVSKNVDFCFINPESANSSNESIAAEAVTSSNDKVKNIPPRSLHSMMDLFMKIDAKINSLMKLKMSLYKDINKAFDSDNVSSQHHLLESYCQSACCQTNIFNDDDKGENFNDMVGANDNDNNSYNMLRESNTRRMFGRKSKRPLNKMVLVSCSSTKESLGDDENQLRVRKRVTRSSNGEDFVKTNVSLCQVNHTETFVPQEPCKTSTEPPVLNDHCSLQSERCVKGAENIQNAQQSSEIGVEPPILSDVHPLCTKESYVHRNQLRGSKRVARSSNCEDSFCENNKRLCREGSDTSTQNIKEQEFNCPVNVLVKRGIKIKRCFVDLSGVKLPKEFFLHKEIIVKPEPVCSVEDAKDTSNSDNEESSKEIPTSSSHINKVKQSLHPTENLNTNSIENENHRDDTVSRPTRNRGEQINANKISKVGKSIQNVTNNKGNSLFSKSTHNTRGSVNSMEDLIDMRISDSDVSVKDVKPTSMSRVTRNRREPKNVTENLKERNSNDNYLSGNEIVLTCRSTRTRSKPAENFKDVNSIGSNKSKIDAELSSRSTHKKNEPIHAIEKLNDADSDDNHKKNKDSELLCRPIPKRVEPIHAVESLKDVNSDSDSSCSKKDSDLSPSRATRSRNKSLLKEQESSCVYGDPTLTEPDITSVWGSFTHVNVIKEHQRDLFLGCDDGRTLRMKSEGELLDHVYSGHDGPVNSIEFYNDYLITGSSDSVIIFHNLSGHKNVVSAVPVMEPVQTLCSRWQMIFIGSKKGKIMIYSCYRKTILEKQIVVGSESDTVLAIHAAKEGPRRILIVAAKNQPLTIRDSSTGLLLRSVNFNDIFYSLAFYGSTPFVYCGTRNNSVAVVDFTAGEKVDSLKLGKNVIKLIIKWDVIFTASYDGLVHIFNLKDKKLIAKFPVNGLIVEMELWNYKIILSTSNEGPVVINFPNELKSYLMQK